MDNIINVKNIQYRDALQNHSENEIVYCEEEQQYFIWKDNQFNPVEDLAKTGEIKLNYRDLLINAISGFEPLDEHQKARTQMALDEWEACQNKEYYMLYGKEINYFTLFHRIPEEMEARCLSKEVLECLQSVGEIIYVEEFDNDNYTIIFWIKTNDNLITEVYLFDYTEGVVPFV